MLNISLGSTYLAYSAAPFDGGAALLAGALSGAAGLALWAWERRGTRDTRALRAELERARGELRASDARYAAAAELTLDALWDWDVKRGTIAWSPRFGDIVGARDRLRPEPGEWFGRIHPGDRARVEAELNAHFAGDTERFESEHRLEHEDGTYRWVRGRALAVFDAHGAATRLTGSFVDVTAEHEAAQPGLRTAMDALTGLPHRALFADVLSRAIARGKRRGDYLYAVATVDVGAFEGVVAERGPSAGDELLTLAARRLEACLRPTDVVARTGAHEFTLLVDDMKATEDLGVVAERVRQSLSRPFAIPGGDVTVDATVGLALGGPQYDEPREILRDAVLALRRAREEGEAVGRHVAPETGVPIAAGAE